MNLRRKVFIPLVFLLLFTGCVSLDNLALDVQQLGQDMQEVSQEMGTVCESLEVVGTQVEDVGLNLDSILTDIPDANQIATIGGAVTEVGTATGQPNVAAIGLVLTAIATIIGACSKARKEKKP